MTDEELTERIVACINQRLPESDSLDYKTLLNIETRDERIELAKDASSFANELGGTLLYGVPEEKVNGVPIPMPLGKCGLKLDGRFPERVENILLESVRPVLPNLFVKLVTIPGRDGKQILIVQHPASWNKPHMVEGYQERRYFRRGNYRTVRMSEVEVEAAYASRRSVRVQAEEFFRVAELGEIPSDGSQFLRIIIFPVLALVAREKMREQQFQEWLIKNHPNGRAGDWVPFVDGVRFWSTASGALQGLQFELRLFHNGAISFTIDMTIMKSDKGLINLARAATIIKKYTLNYAATAFELLGVASPLLFKVELHGAHGLQALEPSETKNPDPLTAGFPLSRNLITYREESSTDELIGQPHEILWRLVARMTETFGIWPNELKPHLIV